MARSLRRCSLPMMLLSIVACLGMPALADDPRDLKIWKELQVETQIDCTDVPLRDLADYLSDLHRIPIYLDVAAFEKAGVVHKSLTFTQHAKNVPLWQVLRDTLKPAKLSFMIKYRALTITTAEAANEWQKKNIGEEK